MKLTEINLAENGGCQTVENLNLQNLKAGTYA